MSSESGLYWQVVQNTNPAAGIDSVETVFAMVAKKYPQLELKLASGALSDINKVSDVDISLLYDPTRASALFTNIVSVMQKPTHTIYSLGGYPREVNVFVSLDEQLVMRAVRHRENELYINTKWPGIAQSAREYKRMGVATEVAYGHAIGFDGRDPYEVMLDRDAINAAIEARQKRLIENVLC
ncbi:hypothetical protein F-M6_0281 [Faustovirus]|nr:hypothetical protein F-M6_0281 [Faustovirus]